MRVTRTAALLAATLAASTVQAADCAHPTTQTDINMCANTSFKAADAKLNAIYKQITDRLKDRHRVRQSLVTAQRAWLVIVTLNAHSPHQPRTAAPSTPC